MPCCWGFQDFSQLIRDYGREEATVIKNTIGNVFVGNVVGETAKDLAERFGKIKQKQDSQAISSSARLGDHIFPYGSADTRFDNELVESGYFCRDGG